jgi:AcrR family transcriptional regulator
MQLSSVTLNTQARTVSLTPKSAATRAKLITVAERLFAEKGVEGVSLAEINRVARQRHSNACHYHFGSKDGLIQAILDKHVPGISANRDAMFDAMEVAGNADIGQIVRAFVRPAAAKLFDPNGGKDFIRLNAQLVARHTMASRGIASPYSLPETGRLTRTLKAAMTARRLPTRLAEGRLLMAAIMLFHGLADYSRLCDAAPSTHDRADTERFIRDLEIMIEGALTAPPGEGMVSPTE